MSAKTNNIYGRILISDSTIERFVSRAAMDCYGIVGLASLNLADKVICVLKLGRVTKGVKVRSTGDRIQIDISITVKYGVSIKAVVEALKESLKYKTERFTGMIVDVINVNVIGVKL